MNGATDSKLPALVVGTGFGCKVHLPALRAAGFEVVGLVGSDAERTKRRAEANGVSRAFIDLDDAITRTSAKAVSLATPPHTHAELVNIAVARGCHVLCEKPFAKNTAEARSMLAVAERAAIVHLVGHEFRWMPERALIGRAVSSGAIGQPRLMTLLNYMPLVASPEAKMPHWWFDIDAGGGWLGASGSHAIDQVRSSVGEFASVSAALPIVSARDGVAEDSYVVRFRLTNGVEGVLQQTAGAWGPGSNVTLVAGTKGTVWIENGIARIADSSGTRDMPIPPELALQSPSALAAFTRLCEAMRDAINGVPSGSGVPLPTFADGVAGMEVIDAIRESAANQGAVVNVDGRE
jgi:predicted dehydrogenase